MERPKTHEVQQQQTAALGRFAEWYAAGRLCLHVDTDGYGAPLRLAVADCADLSLVLCVPHGIQHAASVAAVLKHGAARGLLAYDGEAMRSALAEGWNLAAPHIDSAAPEFGPLGGRWTSAGRWLPVQFWRALDLAGVTMPGPGEGPHHGALALALMVGALCSRYEDQQQPA